MSCPASSVGFSILNCNFVNIRNEVGALVAAGIDFIHLDVMDGCFVDNITFGPDFVRSLIAEFPGQKFEVHMMVTHPEKFIIPMAKAGAQRYIFHYEVTQEALAGSAAHSVNVLIDSIKQNKMEAALAINPDTPIEKVYPYLALVHSILIMTVFPGKGGQKFMADMMDKVKVLRLKSPNMDIELDGGVAPENTDLCGRSGANRAVVGTALLRSTNRTTDIVKMRTELFPRE